MSVLTGGRPQNFAKIVVEVFEQATSHFSALANPEAALASRQALEALKGTDKISDTHRRMGIEHDQHIVCWPDPSGTPGDGYGVIFGTDRCTWESFQLVRGKFNGESGLLDDEAPLRLLAEGKLAEGVYKAALEKIEKPADKMEGLAAAQGPALHIISISNGDEAINLLGEPRLALKKAYITKREPEGEVEIIQTSWGPQEAKKGTHYVAKDAGGEYPYDIDAFRKNMEEVAGRPGYFRKATPSRLIEVPKGVTVECVTIDQGAQEPMKITYPGLIGIGAKNEVYPVTREIFDADFEWK